MKANVHPQYNSDTTVTCGCGNTFTTGSTLKSITVDICSACHPFFTGEMKFVDTQGRVEKFEKMRSKAQAYQSKKKAKEIKANESPKTLKEMLEQVNSDKSN